jgi:hypothetical protein
VGALSEQQFSNAERMAGIVYPLLYVFENSAREFVAGHLEAAYRKVVERNRKASGQERWVKRKNVHPIMAGAVPVRGASALRPTLEGALPSL